MISWGISWAKSWAQSWGLIESGGSGGALDKNAIDDAVRKKHKRTMDAVIWAVGGGTIR